MLNIPPPLYPVHPMSESNLNDLNCDEDRKLDDSYTETCDKDGDQKDKETVTDDFNDDSSEDSNITNLSPEEILTHVISKKEEASQLLQNGETKPALDMYMSALKNLNKMSLDNGQLPDENCQKIETALKSNITLAHLKLTNWSKVVEYATMIINIQPDNEKILFRRGVAYNHLNEIEKSKKDLLHVYKLNPSNKEALRILAEIKQKDIEEKNKQKEVFNKMFSGKCTYFSEQRRLAAEQKAKEEQMKKEETDEYDRENANRVENGLTPYSSIEAWKQAKGYTKGTDSSAQSSSLPHTDTPKPTTTSQLTDQDFDEEDLEIMKATKKMGYCYFKDDVKRVKSGYQTVASQPILTENYVNGSEQQPQTTNDNSTPSSASYISSWNRGGTTYEEKDSSKWAIQNLKSHIQAISHTYDITANSQDFENALNIMSNVSNFTKDTNDLLTLAKAMLPYTVKVISADIEGEAHIIMARLTRRHMYDFKITVAWKVIIPEDQFTDKNSVSVEYEGSIRFTEVCPIIVCETTVSNTSNNEYHEWLNTSEITYKTSIPSNHKNVVNTALDKLKELISCKVSLFEQDYRQYT